MEKRLPDVILAMIEEHTRDDPARLEAETFGTPGEVQKLAPMDAIRLSLEMIQGLKEASVRLAEEIEELRTSSGSKTKG